MVKVVPPKRKASDKKTKARTPHMRTGKRAPATPAQLERRREKRRERAKRISQLAVDQSTQILDLSKELGVSERWIKGKFNAHNYYARSKRKASARNGFIRAKAKTYTKYSGRQKLVQMGKDPDIEAEWVALTEEERKAYAQELEEVREEKENMMHHSAAAQYADANQNITSAVDIITAVANRCNGVFFVYYASKDGDAHGAGIHAVSQEAIPFIKNVLKTTPDALAGRFDAFALSGSAEVDAPIINNVNALKSTARHLISDGFKKHVPREKAQIFYNPLRMLKKYNLEFVGWKGGELPDPSNINTAHALNELINALEAGTARWERVEDDDVEARAEDIIARGEAAGIAYDAPRARRSDNGKRRKQPLGPVDQNAPVPAA